MESLDPQNQTEIDTPETLDAQPSQPNRKSWVGFGCAALLAVGGFGFWRMANSSADRPAVAQPQGQPPRAVETTKLATGTPTRTVQLLGQVESSQQSTIRAQTGGIVEEIFVQPGDRVSEGMAIAILDDSDQQLGIAQAQAELAQQRSNLARLQVGTRPEIITQRQAAVDAAKAKEQAAQDNFKRTSNLVKEGAISQRLLVEARSQVDQAKGERLAAEASLAEAKAGPIREEIDAQKANVEAATATVNQAQLAQRRTQIVATQAGIVQTRHVSQGDLVQSSGQIVTLVSGNQVDVFLELPEDLSGKVTPGMSIALTARALPQWKQQATITAVVPSADATSRRQRVRVQINPTQGILPGMAISGALTIPTERESFVVSRDVLTRRRNEWFVFTIADKKAKPIRVELVTDMGKQVAIFSPELRSGQEIVIRGGDGLNEDTPVKIVGDKS
ncbi:MAG: efflux RND transporter periplasmic adaptor subunit [Leptolyngbya sp. Prado105]|jgi:multidrug efflux pump subunit AcrA (membrane-fusion protein)|nr:efflux RND transporter periplasmic adaptor subunit [Leptolyngbya sp. Prado105]